MKDFSRLAALLYQVVGKYKFQWGSEQERAFTALKDALTHPPVLALPNQCDAFVLDTDASDFAIGVMGEEAYPSFWFANRTVENGSVMPVRQSYLVTCIW